MDGADIDSESVFVQRDNTQKNAAQTLFMCEILFM